LIAAVDLSAVSIEAEGAGRLAAMLGQCPSLTHLDLGGNDIGDEGVNYAFLPCVILIAAYPALVSETRA